MGMDSVGLEKKKLQKKIFELIFEIQKTEKFMESMIGKARNPRNEDMQALRANFAILKERTNKKIEIYKKRLIELRQKATA